MIDVDALWSPWGCFAAGVLFAALVFAPFIYVLFAIIQRERERSRWARWWMRHGAGRGK